MGVGKQIRAARRRKVWGQAELARQAGITPTTLWRIEAGANEPLPVTVRKIAKALGVDPAELVGEAAYGTGGA